MIMLALSSMSTEVCTRKAASVKYSTAKSERTPSKCKIFDAVAPVTSLQWQWHLAVKDLQALGEEPIPPPATPILSSKVQVLKQDFGGSGLRKWVPCPHFHTVNGTHITDFSCKERSVKPAQECCGSPGGVFWILDGLRSYQRIPFQLKILTKLTGVKLWLAVTCAGGYSYLALLLFPVVQYSSAAHRLFRRGNISGDFPSLFPVLVTS